MTVYRAAGGSGLVVAVFTAASITLVPASSGAQAPIAHRVTYTVSARVAVQADIYYRDTEPPSWAAYSHNPYLFSPKAEAEIGPEKPWVLEVMLTNPQQWAMVSATSGMSPLTPEFQCELAVDGIVVTSGTGPKGALCSLRHW